MFNFVSALFARWRRRRPASKPPLGVSLLRACPGCGKEFFIDSVGGIGTCDPCAFAAAALSADVSRARRGNNSTLERYS